MINWGSGFFDTWGSIPNSPGDTSHYVGVQAFHYTNGYNSGYGWQIAGGPTSSLWWRNIWSSASGWRRFIDSGNIGSQSVANASNFNNGYVYSTGNNIYFRASGGSDTLRIHSYSTAGNVIDFSSRIFLRNMGAASQHLFIDTEYWIGKFFTGVDPYTNNNGLGAEGGNYNGAIMIDGDWRYAMVHYGGILNISDGRFKHQQLPIKNAIQKVKGITGKTYYLNKQNFLDAGVIAQEVKEVFPVAVAGDGDKLNYAVNYNALTALLIQAVKEQQEIIENLQQRIEILETQ
jgi:hypothetical protein